MDKKCNATLVKDYGWYKSFNTDHQEECHRIITLLNSELNPGLKVGDTGVMTYHSTNTRGRWIFIKD